MKEFNTGERVPGGERTPKTPAELTAQAADDLAGILRAHFSHPSGLEGGGSRRIIENFERALKRFTGALIANAKEAENQDVMRFMRPYESLASHLNDSRYGSIDG